MTIIITGDYIICDYIICTDDPERDWGQCLSGIGSLCSGKNGEKWAKITSYLFFLKCCSYHNSGKALIVSVHELETSLV